MNVKLNVEIEIEGQTINLDYEQAKKLYHKLKDVFDSKQKIEYPLGVRDDTFKPSNVPIWQINNSRDEVMYGTLTAENVKSIDLNSLPQITSFK